MHAILRYERALIIFHVAATLFMVGLIWTIHTVHYPLFAYVGDATYPSFQAEHVERIGKLLLVPWLLEGSTMLAIAALAFLGRRKDLRLPSLLNGVNMAIVLIISGFWSAPAHGDLADGFDPAVHDRLMNANLIRTLAWTLCGVSAIWILVRAWTPTHQDNIEKTS